MKKLLYTPIMILLSVLLLTGCDDFLEHEEYGAQQKYWTSEADIQDAIVGFYSFTWEEGVTGRGFMWFENCSDNMVTGRSQAEAEQIKNFIMSPANGRDAKDNFENMYQLIAKTNALLKNVPNMDNVSDAVKTNALGSAYFFRGFAYLWLAPWYADNGPNGGLPILTEETPVEEIDQVRPESVLENYDMIIEDMRKAGDMLPLLSQMAKSDYGLPHKAAAWAFAARAALYAAQYDAKYYATVIEMCDKVIGLTGADKRDLFDDNSANPFANLWREENNFSPEYIFSLLGNANEGPKFHGMSFQNGGWGFYNTWGYFQPTLELYKAFDPADKRREATILYPGESIMFGGVNRIYGVNPQSIASTSGMTFRKFMSPWENADCKGKTVNPNTDNSSNNLGTCLIRFADILLMKAEALIWTQGEGNGEAKILLNRIRKRARLPENSPATKEELKTQRRLELVFEFQPSRHLDLVRWGDAQQVYSNPLHGVKSTTDGTTITNIEEIEIWPSRTFNPGINHVFPIPAYIISSSDKLKQNIGY